MIVILCAWCGQEIEIDCDTMSSIASTWSAGLCPACEEQIEQQQVKGWFDPAKEQQ